MNRIAQRQLRPAGWLALIALVCAGIFALIQTGVVGASQEPVLVLEPVGEVHAGELITVKLVAHNVQNLAGFQATVQYGVDGLRLTGAGVPDGLSRSGRGLLPLGPVMLDSSVVLGAATCPIGDCSTADLRSARRIDSGVSGTVDLGTLEFYSATPGSYTLALDAVQLVDPQGAPVLVRTEGLTLDVRP